MKKIFILTFIIGIAALVLFQFVPIPLFFTSVPSPKVIAEQKRMQERREYRKNHPEENKQYALLAAKYNVDPVTVQNIIDGEVHKAYKQREKDRRVIIAELAKELKINESTVASIIIDYDLLDPDRE